MKKRPTIPSVWVEAFLSKFSRFCRTYHMTPTIWEFFVQEGKKFLEGRMSRQEWSDLEVPETRPYDENNLRPCPFCGHPAQWMINGIGSYIGCSNADCGIFPTSPYAGARASCRRRAEVAEMWNRRNP